MKEEIKAVIWEKFEFEYRDLNLLIPFFAISGLSRSQCKEQKWWFLDWVVVPSEILSIEKMTEKIKQEVLKTTQFISHEEQYENGIFGCFSKSGTRCKEPNVIFHN